MTTIVGCLALYVFWRFIVWDYKRTVRLEQEHQARSKYEVPSVIETKEKPWFYA